MAARETQFAGVPRSAIAFKPEYLDFDRGIRVGHLEDDARISRLLKLELEHRYRQPFVTERWGRGVHWQWIGYLPKANRTAKPLSSSVSFGCSKFFLSVNTAGRRFECGMQVERGFVKAPPEHAGCQLASDWDWHRLLKSLKRGGRMEREIRRLVRREGFLIHAGCWDGTAGDFKRANLPEVSTLRRMLLNCSGREWAGFQLYYAMNESEVRSSTGLDLVESMLAIFDEVTPAMNLCMQIELSGGVLRPQA
jgi:hypothetical protein